MIQLRTRGKSHNIVDPIVAKNTSNGNGSVLHLTSKELDEMVVLTTTPVDECSGSERKVVGNIPSLDHIENGDILLITPNGVVQTLFRPKSLHNSLFITDRCNSNCLMCSQPPKNKDDLDFFFAVNTQLVKMIPTDTKELGITGGEPTLLGKRFIELLELITECLPDTEIHILTNGRSFAWKNIPKAICELKNPRIVFGIPLYSDFFQQHDYIVQAKDAFNQTILGLHNMARYNLRIELRIVLHEQTYRRLPQLAKYIYKNLPFGEHVAFMGLEYTGYTPFNNDLLWVEPSKYSDELEEAVRYLDAMEVTISIYNLQLCLIKPSLWGFTRNSISDWKRDSLKECGNCNLLKECGGVFSTSKKHSMEIKAIRD